MDSDDENPLEESHKSIGEQRRIHWILGTRILIHMLKCTLLASPTRHHLLVSPPTCLDPQRPLGPRGPTLGVSLCPRGVLRTPGEPYSLSLVRFPTPCLDPQGPHTAQRPIHWVFLCSPGPLGPRGERPRPCHRDAQRDAFRLDYCIASIRKRTSGITINVFL
jgi:hypothetical protein